MPTQDQNPSSLSIILGELETLLMDERQALVALDRDRIEAFAERKLELDQRLQAANEQRRPETSDLDRLRRIRALSLTNQLLLVHARSCIKGVLSLMARDPIPKHPGQETAAGSPAPVALNFRT